MSENVPIPSSASIPLFDRSFFHSDNIISQIGGGAIGGKAAGRVFAHRVLKDVFPAGECNGMLVSIPRVDLVQVRPTVLSGEGIEVTDEDLKSEQIVIASERVHGNGYNNDLVDIVFVRPADFEKEHTRKISAEIDTMNRRLVELGRRYVLIGFGRWGSSDPWLGIPVDGGNISGAQALVEATLPDMNIELSRGSHLFHNFTSLQLYYFNVRHTGRYKIDWEWLGKQKLMNKTDHVSHVQLVTPLTVMVDGRRGRGVILK